MARVGSMGGRITAPAQKGKSLRSRLSLSGRRKVVKVNDKVGELQSGPSSSRQAAAAAPLVAAAPLTPEPPVGSPATAPLAMGCDNCVCWEGRGAARSSAGGSCNFSREYVPSLPDHCLSP